VHVDISAALFDVGLERHLKRSNEMRVMVIVPAGQGSEEGALPSDELVTAMQKFNEELVKAGVWLMGEGLQASEKGARVRFDGKKRTVIDGPFTEAKELIAGFWLWQVRSMDEAIEWIKRAPFDGGVEIEIRPIFESEDFVKTLSPEVQEREERLRQQVAAKQ
jgi:hypothetical protein